MKKIFLIIIFVITVISLFDFPTNVAFGADEMTIKDTETCSPEKTCIHNPIDTNTPQELIGKVISAVLGISGSLALLMFIYGGFTWMLSGGNAEKVTKGKNTLVWASIGLIVIFSSYAMVNTLFKGLAGS